MHGSLDGKEEEDDEEEITGQRCHGAAASRLHGMSKRRPWASAEGDRLTGDACNPAWWCAAGGRVYAVRAAWVLHASSHQ